MRSSKWFLICSGAILIVELALPPLFGGRSVGSAALGPVSYVEGLLGQAQAIGVAVSDRDAAVLKGAATVEPECTGWDVDSGGCCWICFLDECPDNFDTFDSDNCLYCEYTASKQNSTRECSAGGNAAACSNVIDSIIGCTVGP